MKNDKSTKASSENEQTYPAASATDDNISRGNIFDSLTQVVGYECEEPDDPSHPLYGRWSETRTLVLRDAADNLYTHDGLPLPPEYDLSGTVEWPYEILMDSPETDWDIESWHMGTWPRHPDDTGEDGEDSPHIEFVCDWMRNGYKEAVQRYREFVMPETDDRTLLKWGARDPYFGPIMRGYTGHTNGEIGHPENLHPTVRYILVGIVTGEQTFPSSEEWENIYHEVLESEKRQLVGEQIADGYKRIPPTSEEDAMALANARRMIEEEPW